VKYAFIAEHTGQFQVTAMARVLGVARSGFYAWQARQGKVSARAQAQHGLDAQVAEAFAAAKERSGAIRITKALAKQGVAHNRKTVAKSLRRQGLRAKAARKFKATTQSRHNLPVADNLLAQNFSASAPNQKWAGDITYLWTDEGWLYLAVVLDLYSRRVIGWAMSERMTAQLVCDALQMALFRRKQPRGVIVHSDQGSQYCSQDFQALLNAPRPALQHERQRQLLRQRVPAYGRGHPTHPPTDVRAYLRGSGKLAQVNIRTIRAT